MIKKDSSHKAGRLCNEECSELVAGMDFRDPKYRREVFLRFYEFHLKYKAHPGAVYYMMPYISEKYSFDIEDKLWFAYINGCSQNILTTYAIYQEFPSFKDINLDKFSSWFRENYNKLGWDTDRRYVKNKLEKCIENYKTLIGDKPQEEFFNSFISTNDQFENFRNLWNAVITRFSLFGRLSTFSYLEYLRIMGLNIDCDSLFLYDMNGSKSHRNGLCKVLGRDDLDWHDTLNPGFEGYTPEIIEWLIEEGKTLIDETKERLQGKPYFNDVSYFTLESTLCCYKSFFRKNRRFPNTYNDMFFKRIKYAETQWGDYSRFDIFWEARKKYLPEYLRVECNLNDPTHNQTGLSQEKQNHFRKTGQLVMMDKEWSCFKNDFNDKYYHNTTNLSIFFE